MKTTTCLMTLLTIATLKIGQYLKFLWSLLSYMGFIVPKFIRDWVYNQIAGHRY